MEEHETVIYREEVLAVLGVLGDINVNLRRLLAIAEGDDGEEEEED